MGNKGLKTVIMCVLVLGIVLEHVQVEGKSCCKSIFARNSYNICRLSGPPIICAAVCDCKIIKKGTNCPRGYPSLNFLPETGEPDASEFCSLGCRYSVCDNMNNVDGGKEMKIHMERCGDACDSFCSGEVVAPKIAT